MSLGERKEGKRCSGRVRERKLLLGFDIGEKNKNI